MIGSRLGSWILDRQLGRGGMGCVYLAHDADDPGRLAAVKVLAAELTVHSGAVHRFEREIKVLAKLNHPNIVRFYESGTGQGLLYYVMEYVEGRDFAELLEEQGRLPWSEVLDAAVQVCAALKQANDYGVIHRDLKPSNLLRGNDGRVRLTDFGVAHAFAEPHLTRAGAVVGTAEYLSPEQAAGKLATHRSDLYSLGCVLYTLLCGRTPFSGENVLDLLHKHRYAQFDPPRKVLPELPHEIDEVVCQLLEKEPDKRPPNAGVLGRRLEVLRRKLGHRSDHTIDAVVSQATHLGDTLLAAEDDSAAAREGPATLMSRLMRRELEAQNRGGAVRQFFNRPAVLVVLFLLCLAALAWTFWPQDPEKVFQDNQGLLQSENDDEFADGWEKLRPVKDKLAKGSHAADIERYERRYQDYQETRAAAWQGGRLGEAQWFYQEGLRRRQRGDLDGAKAMWGDLVRGFRDVPAECRWVRLAEKELERQDEAADARRWDSVRQALARARRLRAEGHPEEAEEVYKALEKLYRDDPSATDILDEVRRQR
jgi:serine/threonine-protein kinase